MNYEIDLKNAKTRADLYDLLEQELPLSEIPEETQIHFLDRECREYELERYLRRLKRMFGGLMEENPNIRVSFDSDNEEEGQ